MKVKKKSKVPTLPKYKRTIEWDDDDQIWVVIFPELPGCSTHGKTIEEAVQNADDALKLYLESLAARGIQAPEPVSTLKASGKFMVRTNPELHKRLLVMASNKEKSMNKLVEEILENGAE